MKRALTDQRPHSRFHPHYARFSWMSIASVLSLPSQSILSRIRHVPDTSLPPSPSPRISTSMCVFCERACARPRHMLGQSWASRYLFCPFIIIMPAAQFPSRIVAFMHRYLYTWWCPGIDKLGERETAFSVCGFSTTGKTTTSCQMMIAIVTWTMLWIWRVLCWIKVIASHCCYCAPTCEGMKASESRDQHLKPNCL